MLKKNLLEFGLSQNETDMYLYLLKHGLSSPAEIAKGTHLQRSNTYPVLNTLKQKNLIREEKLQGKKKVYLATDPEALYRSIEDKQLLIKEILPDLRALRVQQKNKPSIQFFEGKEQLKEVYLSALESDEIFAIGSTHSLTQLFPRFFKTWVEEIKIRKVVFNDILTHASAQEAGPLMKELLKGYYDVSYLSPSYDDLPTDILIWNDTIALIALEEPYFATILTNPPLAKTMKMLFKVMKDSLRENL